MVRHPSAHDAVYPGGHLRPAVIAVDRLRDRDQGILGDIIHGGGIQQCGAGETAHHSGRIEGLDEQLECFGERDRELRERGQHLVLRARAEESVGGAAGGVDPARRQVSLQLIACSCRRLGRQPPFRPHVREPIVRVVAAGAGRRRLDCADLEPGGGTPLRARSGCPITQGPHRLTPGPAPPAAPRATPPVPRPPGPPAARPSRPGAGSLPAAPSCRGGPDRPRPSPSARIRRSGRGT